MPASMRRLAWLAVAGGALAATGVRRNLNGAKEASSRLAQEASSRPRRDASAAQRYALNRTHVEALCTEEVAVGACRALGNPADADTEVTAAQLADMLAAGEAEAAGLLRSVGLGDVFTCRAFCEAAVSHIPQILSTAAPPQAGSGCLYAACAVGATVDVSAGALAEDGGLESPPPPPGAREDIIQVPQWENNSQQYLDPEVAADLLFRTALNVVLGIFPALLQGGGDAEEDSGNPGGRPPVDFARNTQLRRHREYTEYVMKASGWIALALRRLRSGRHYIQKWFILKAGSQVHAQMREARRHLTRMLQLMNYVFIKTGTPDHPCEVIPDRGVLAYVFADEGCTTQTLHDCGEKNDEGRYIVNICEFFWLPEFRTAVRVGTLVHEASHHFGTRDWAYCDITNCLALASSEAKENADSYLQLVSELVMDLSVYEDGHGIKDESCNVDCDATQFEQWDFSVELPNGHCGICAEKAGIFFGCAAPAIQVASSFIKQVCCEPVQCETTTRTTTTTKLLQCPSGTTSPRPSGEGCACSRGSYCSMSLGQSADCDASNTDGAGDRYFHVSCETCRCYPVKQSTLQWLLSGAPCLVRTGGC